MCALVTGVQPFALPIWLVRSDGSPWPGWASLAMAANPWFWMAATSLGDFVWAPGLVLGGALAASRDRRLLAGVMFGLALGCRSSRALVVAAWLLAERPGQAAQDRQTGVSEKRWLERVRLGGRRT